MFTPINKQGVKSDQGFEVQVVDRFTIEYREGGKTMSIYVEGDKEMLSDYLFSKWDPPFSHIQIPEERQKQIRQNFNAALKALDAM
jgi:hypothetical protein